MTRLELSRGRLRYLAKESLMPATLLATRRVDKPWGRHILWPGFPDPAPDGAPVGEVWFQTPGDANPDLLVKYLFTSEKLSVQVHPNDAAARKAGYPRGKDAFNPSFTFVDAGSRSGTVDPVQGWRSEEHTSALQSLMRISYAVFCLKKKNNTTKYTHHYETTQKENKNKPYEIFSDT